MSANFTERKLKWPFSPDSVSENPDPGGYWVFSSV